MNFHLTDNFIDGYKDLEPKWGPLGEFVYLRTYSRFIEEENRKEKWFETVKRVVEGCFDIQKKHCDSLKLVWNTTKSQKSAQVMYDKIFNFKFLPPGRGLWAMGTKFVDEKGGAALNNCGFISTEDIDVRGSFAFTWTMDALMLGVGIGFDTKGAGRIKIKEPKEDGIFTIPDSREGWVESLQHVLDAFFNGKGLPIMDYNLIRPYGTPIKGFGGVASGPQPLKELHENITKLLIKRIGERITSTDIVDIVNMIGVCVVSGNVRRSACIALGEYSDTDYVTMKDYNLHPEEVNSHRWASNNSVFAEVGKTDYSKFTDSIALNGEPGIVWLDNIRKFSRTIDAPDWKDSKAVGVNPCLVGDSIIETTKGRITIKEMSERFASGEDFDVYSMNSKGELEIKPAYNIVATKETDSITTITLSTGKTIQCTPDHKIFVLDLEGNIIQVEAQKIDTSQHFPIFLQRIKKSEKYLRVKLNTQTKYVPEHRFVMAAYEDIEGLVIHHLDGITYNNTKDNLEALCAEYHSRISNEGHEDWGDRDETTGQFLSKEDKVKKGSIIITEEYLTNNGFTGGKAKFTKVITDSGLIPVWVYDMSVVDNHNFIANGIVVHNCSEQTLENAELCCLVETFPSLHETLEEYKETIKYAYLYGKSVTLVPTHWPETNAVLLKNRRIGLSQSGIIDAFVKHGRREMLSWSNDSYQYVQKLDQIYSDWLCVPRSKKTTTVKPSGTVSLLCGVSPGIHYPHAKYYIRRIRVAQDDAIISIMAKAGYNIEPDKKSKNTSVIDFPVHEQYFIKKKDNVSIWEQVKNVVDYQRFWADNNVSVTITFKPEEVQDIPRVLEAYEDVLKAISFLPLENNGYEQMPYEEIDVGRYESMLKALIKPDFTPLTTPAIGTKFCDGDSCLI